MVKRKRSYGSICLNLSRFVSLSPPVFLTQHRSFDSKKNKERFILIKKCCPPSLIHHYGYTTLYHQMVYCLNIGVLYLKKLFFFNLFLLRSYMFWGVPRGVMVKAMDCRIVVSEFVLQSRNCIHFQERYEPLYPPSYGLNNSTYCSSRRILWP